MHQNAALHMKKKLYSCYNNVLNSDKSFSIKKEQELLQISSNIN